MYPECLLPPPPPPLINPPGHLQPNRNATATGVLIGGGVFPWNCVAVSNTYVRKGDCDLGMMVFGGAPERDFPVWPDQAAVEHLVAWPKEP